MGSHCTHLVGEVKAGLGTADCHDDRQVSVLTGNVQRCVAMAILLVVVTVVSEEATDHFNLTPSYGQMKGCVAILERYMSPVMVRMELTAGQVHRTSFCIQSVRDFLRCDGLPYSSKILSYLIGLAFRCITINSKLHETYM